MDENQGIGARLVGLKEFILRRLILMVPVALGAVILVFAMTQMIPPADRAYLYIHDEKQVKELPTIIRDFHLDASPLQQFVIWFGQLLHGNLGWSVVAKAPVVSVILAVWPATFEIVIFAAPLTMLIGIYLGVQSAVRKDKLTDHLTRLVSISGYSIPSFLLALVLIAIVFTLTGLTIVGRLSHQYVNVVSNVYLWRSWTGLYTIDGILNGRLDITLDALEHLILPIVVITAIYSGGLIRIMRSSMLETLTKSYIITATAKGLSRKQVINKHARKNALIPVITISGMLIVGMLSGLVIVETVFNFGGLGSWVAQSALKLDIAGVVGFTLVTALLFVISNLIVDVLYAYLDPRIKLG